MRPDAYKETIKVQLAMCSDDSFIFLENFQSTHTLFSNFTFFIFFYIQKGMHSPAVQKRSARITSECDKNIPRKPSRMHVVQCVAMCRELSKVTVDEHDDFLFDCSGSAGRGL